MADWLFRLRAERSIWEHGSVVDLKQSTQNHITSLVHAIKVELFS